MIALNSLAFEEDLWYAFYLSLLKILQIELQLPRTNGVQFLVQTTMVLVSDEKASCDAHWLSKFSHLTRSMHLSTSTAASNLKLFAKKNT